MVTIFLVSGLVAIAAGLGWFLRTEDDKLAIAYQRISQISGITCCAALATMLIAKML